MAQHFLIVEDELAIAETLLYAFKNAGFGTSHYLFGHSVIVEINS